MASLVEDLGLGPECAGGVEIVNDRQTIRLVGEFGALRRLVYVFGLLTNSLGRTLPAESLAYSGREADEAQAEFIAGFIGDVSGSEMVEAGARLPPPGDNCGGPAGSGAPRPEIEHRGSLDGRENRGSLESRGSVDANSGAGSGAEVVVGGYPGSVGDAGLRRESSADFARPGSFVGQSASGE